MEYKRLGRSGLKVLPICLGTMMFGGRSSEAVSGKIIGSARDAGINFIDTADVYVKGESERIVGKFLRRDRDHWVLATKVFGAMGRGPNERGLGRKWIQQAIDASLGRLKTDYVDIYYLHKEDDGTPLEETIGAMGDLIAAGKIRYWGLSNFLGWHTALVVSLAERMGVPRPVVHQPYYNAANRMPEQEILPACKHFGLGVVPYSPLARGVLTGKYGDTLKEAKGTRAGAQDKRLMETEWRQENLVLARTLKAQTEKRGMTAGQFALNWVLNNEIVTSVLAGPRTMDQWKEYLGALKHDFTADDEALVDNLVPTGHPSTPGYSDPQYPYQGRQPLTG